MPGKKTDNPTNSATSGPFSHLKPKEKRVVDAYLAEECGGNGALMRVAERTGLSYGWVRQVMMRPAIKKAVEDRRAVLGEYAWTYVQATESMAQPIIDRVGRMQRLSRVIDDEEERTRDRLKALELLGKMEGDYIERVQHEGSEANPVVSKVSLEDKIAQITGKKLAVDDDDPLA